MSKTITIPDLSSTQAAFVASFRNFSVSKQSDGAGSVAAMATLSMSIPDSNGNEVYVASYTAELTPSATSALLSYMITNMLPGLKTQEGL